MSGLGTIINQECGVLATFTHVQSSKVERTLYATTLVKHNRERLLDASSYDLHCFRGFVGAIHHYFDFLVYVLGV